MGTINPLKQVWKGAAERFLSTVTLVQQPQQELMDMVAVVLRRRKTEADRAKTWYDVLRDWMVAQMLEHGVIERLASRRTFYQIKPNTTFGTGEVAEKRYLRLVDEFGQDWVDEHVIAATTHIPAHDEVNYTLVAAHDTGEMLSLTLAMGNKPTFEIGEPPLRVRSGQERNAKKRKRS